MGLVTTKKACEILGIHSNTLRNWANEGKITFIRTPGNHRLYDISNLSIPTAKINVCYCRVSSAKQKDDLKRQIDFLKQQYPKNEIITDVGSGLSFKRKNLLSLLERVNKGDIGEIVVAHKDRLSRFGFDIIEWICKQNSCKLVVLDKSILSPESELSTDILSIIHVFSCRLHGLRKYKQKIKEDKDISNNGAEGKVI